MTVLTSTGNVNLTSATNWSPAQIPVNGDDLVLANGHTLTVDADLILDSITVNSSTTSRMVPSGTTRTLTVNNGITYLGSAGASATVGQHFCNVTTGTFVLISSHFGSGNFNRFLFSQSGGALELSSPTGAAGVLTNINAVLAFFRFYTSNAASTLVTNGIMSPTSAANGQVFISITDAITWTHNHTGEAVSSQGGTNDFYVQVSGAAAKTITWTGNLFSSQNNLNPSSCFWLAGTCTVTFNGTLRGAGTAQLFSVAKLVFVQNAAAVFILNGSIYSETLATMHNSVFVSAGEFRWINQTATVPANHTLGIHSTGGVVNVSGLNLNNSGRVVLTVLGTATANNSPSIINQTTTAQAYSSVLGVTVIALPSNPPTLPPQNKVEVGQVYGYASTPLTGTGLIVDSAVLSTSVGLALESISAAALARFATVNTGQTAAATGSVAALSQGGSGGGGDSKEDIYTYFTASDRQNAFKADVSQLATKTDVEDAALL